MTDYLNEDVEIPSQKYACISFLSPENILKNKELYLMQHFLNELNTELKLDYKDINTKFEDFRYRSEVKLSEQFDSENNNQTSIRGLKVKGTYSTLDEAKSRADKFQKLDKSHHVFIVEVGKWSPWDPSYKYLDDIDGQEYQSEELNNLMHSYKQNEVNKDIFFQERKEESMKDALNTGLDDEDPWLKKREAESQTSQTPIIEDDIVIEEIEDNKVIKEL